MAPSTQVDLLEPIDLAEHLDKIELYLGQVCQIAGISKMQLDYWTNKAQIPTKGKKQRIYDIDALETVMLIKQAKDKGLNLGAAIEAARRFRETNRVAAVDHPRALVELAAQVPAETAISLVSLGRRGGWLVPEPDELRVGVLKARAGRPPLVDACEEMRVAGLPRGLGPQAPGFGHEL